MLMISIVVQCNRNDLAMRWDCIAYNKHVVHCIWIAMLMISIVVQCNRNDLAMRWDCYAYDKHSCAMQ